MGSPLAALALLLADQPCGVLSDLLRSAALDDGDVLLGQVGRLAEEQDVTFVASATLGDDHSPVVGGVLGPCSRRLLRTCS
jgi:hypothetical protein